MNISIGGSSITTLTIVFILLKAFDKINWSWWWVFSPLWITSLLILITFLSLCFVGRDY